MEHFRYSLFVMILGFIAIALWGWYSSSGDVTMVIKLVGITAILVIMEVSLSFDNAVVNASILKKWDHYWKMLFLTVGILIAVFGMRLIFPIVIVAQTADMGFVEVWDLALNNPTSYSSKLTAYHAEVSAFGGMFLLLVFLHFLFDSEKELHWLPYIEEKISKLGKIDAISTLIALVVLMVSSSLINSEHEHSVLVAGIWGVITYRGVQLIGTLLEEHNEKLNSAAQTVAKGSIGGFLYLEVLDASFSFDGVIGAFAITQDVIVIMVGLGIGAMFVRSMTIYLVEKETLDSYIYLEHGAHYAIGALAIIMVLNTTGLHIPEVITGLTGVGLILISLYSSHKHKTSGSVD